MLHTLPTGLAVLVVAFTLGASAVPVPRRAVPHHTHVSRHPKEKGHLLMPLMPLTLAAPLTPEPVVASSSRLPSTTPTAILPLPTTVAPAISSSKPASSSSVTAPRSAPTASSRSFPVTTATPPPPAPATKIAPLVIQTVTSIKTAPVVTVFQTATVTATLTAPAGGGVPTPAPSATWSLASAFGTDLPAELGVKTWEWGQTNVQVLAGVPATAWAAATPAATAGAAKALVRPNMDYSNATVMQVLYPSGSINPANKVAPVGGTGMYLTPLDLSAAKNVTLEYSIFFPTGFDFVKGGKMPGLYGGHTGCSGGQSSEDCFSTRLMFRTGGLGEMYLYAPKTSQPASLCQTLPMSLCDGPYGFSIGRGAWTFKTGEWTHVRQDVVLNTPGVGDGSFQVFINGELKLKANEVLFRKAAPTPEPDVDNLPTPVDSPGDPLATASVSIQGGLLGGILGNTGLGGGLGGGLLGGLRKRQLPVGTGVPVPPKALSSALSAPANSSAGVFRTVGHTTVTVTLTPTSTRAITATSTLTPLPTAAAPPLLSGAKGVLGSLLNTKKNDVTFIGVAFNCFFGGNSKSYASSKDQYTYFNRISMSINA